MSEALTVYAEAMDLTVRRPAPEVLEEARKAAAALKDVIDKKAKKVQFNGEQYLEFEDWQTCGRFYSVTAKVLEESVKYVQFGTIKGFTATAVALRADGAIISSATAACLDDEEKWRSKPKYDRQIQMTSGDWVTEPIDEAKHPKNSWKWNDNPRRPESRRIKVGDEPVPLFQVMSMAQTRACAKVLRQVLAWVVVLAGYRPTPAEELEGPPDGHQHPGPVDVKDAEIVQEKPKAPVSSGTTQGAPGTQPTAAPAPGVTTVKSVKVTTGKNKQGEWTKYWVVFEDGRNGSTFSDTLGREFQAAAKADPKTPVNPDLVQTEDGKYWNIRGLLPLVVASAPAEEPQHPDEPVAGPEKILVVRPVSTEHGDRWIIQTDKRELVTDKEAEAEEARKARDKKLGILPDFDVVPSASNPRKTVNRLKALNVQAAVAGREPGQEG